MISLMLVDISNMANNIPEQKAVFFDRDGTLNVEKNYLYKIQDFQWLPEAKEAIAYCHQLGYLVLVVTNQSGVARGYYQEEDIQKLHQWMGEQFPQGQGIDGFYYCPHHPQGTVPAYTQECNCRKPKPGMILAACEQWHINPQASLMVGDKPRDIASGLAAGVPGVLYEGGSLLQLLKEHLPRA